MIKLYFQIFNETGKFATSTPNPSPVGASGTELGAVCAHSGIGNNMNNSPQPVTSHPESVHTCQCRTAGPHIQQLYLNESINRTNAEPCGKDTCLSNTTKIDRNGLDEALIVKGLAFARTQVKYLQTTLSAIKQTIEELGRNQSVREESFQLSCTDSAPKGSCSTDQIHYYQNKLLSTMQILSNKDEMLAIQEESLKMAEVRMSTLAVRNAQLQAELDKKIYEIKMLRQELEMKGRTPPPPDRNGSKTISKLQNNLSVIEKLYRDCFYESARQEEMIEMLRTSFLEVRLKNSEKSEEIDRLRGVVVSQKWNLERCQDIAQELDSLKGEIASALNNANNDSGVWERSEDSSQGDISRDLQDITQQLLQLKRVLSTDCTCGLRAENGTLKKANDMLNSQIADLNERLDTLEIAVTNRDNTIEHYKSQIKEHETEIQQLAANLRESERCREELLKDKEDLLKEKEEQLSEVTLLRTALRGVESSATATRQRTHETAQEMANARTSIEGLKDRLKNSKFQVKCRRSDAGRLQAICQAHESTIEKQREELSKAQLYLKENAKMRSEISYLSNQVKLWQAQLSESSQKVKELEEQLAVAQAAYDELQCSYRSKRESAVWLEHELAEASSRGAELCAESRHMVCGVRQWMQRMRQQHQEQQRKIQELQRKLRMVKMKLAASGTSQVGFVDCCYDPYARTSKGCLQSKRRSTEKSRCSMERSLPEAGSCSQGSTDIQTSPTPPSSLHFSKQMRCSDCIQNQSQPPGQCEEGTTSPSDDLTAAMDNAGADFRWHNQQWIERMKIFKSGSDQH